MSFPRHPAYKDSGVEWLGEVPEHWDVAPLKRSFSVTLGKMLQPDSSGPDDELLPYLRAANIQWEGIDVSDIKQMWLSPRDREQLTLQPGDLLVSEGGDVGRSCMWAGEVDNCSFQNSVNRVRAIDGGSTRFLYYWMSTIKDRGYVDVLCNKSTIAHFTAEKVAAVPVPLPPNAEQLGVAEFLDHETAKIDALVAEQERLIELLKEKRQAVISHAVTKGLDPSVPMKDSGVAWLGEVPAHWEIVRIKDCGCEVVDCKNRTPEPHDDGDFFVVRTSCVKDGKFNPEPGYWTDEANFIEWTAKGRPQVGDVLFTREAPTGEACLAPEELNFCLGQRMMFIRPPKETLLSEFLLYSIYGGLSRERINEKSKGSTVGHLRVGEVGELPLLLPPLDEQRVLTAFVGSELAELQALANAAEQAILLMTERRTALIFAAITGQIDVRGWVPAAVAT